ncbi:murein hydrolase activator EnvC family protein [Methylobacter marinus]|jgi:murein hydrolase activator|uniref:murein hydrolase activator EnvC family protein n=1 Tax=Methylobacter marinus TaxID=34058 RepID=UPI00036487A5|nr:peptidoglycan DD-metalloendopeptidase family protein [Methylobacter marinus]
MRKKIVFCFLLGAFINQGIAGVSQKSKELGEIRSDIKSVEQNMERIQQKKDALTAQLAGIEKKYGKTVALLKDLQEQINQKRQNLSKTQTEIQHYQDEVRKHNQELASQIKAAYAMGRKEKLKLMLNQQDPALSSRMMVYYNYLNKARLRRLADIEDAMSHLGQLDKQKLQETELLEQNLEQKKAEQLALASVRKQRSEVLAQLDRDFSSNEQRLSSLKDSENELMALIASLQNGSSGNFAFETESAESVTDKDGLRTLGKDKDDDKTKADFSTLKGRLPWPVEGRLAQKFGSPRSEALWDGVLIDAQEGAEIHAVTRGEVVYAEWLRGYGLLTIIDHGKGYMSLYAFNQSLYKRVGEWVEAGEVIASVGQSGGRSQPGLYFGIRRQGKPVDPLEWCRKVSQDHVG